MPRGHSMRRDGPVPEPPHQLHFIRDTTMPTMTAARTRQHHSVPLASVTTVLTPAERSSVDAAGEGVYRSIHRETVSDVVRDLRESRANAVVVSVRVCESAPAEPLSTLVRNFPRIPTLALLSEVSARTPATLLSLGTSGVRRLIDVRAPSGWMQLRTVLADECGDTIQRLALEKLSQDLAGASDGCWRFFKALFLATPDICTIRRLAASLNVLSSTLMSRFFRAHLPSPKAYLATARLVRAARLFENRGFSVNNVANHLQYSSPQSFGRHLRALIGVTAAEFRERFDGRTMLDRFRADLIAPHVDRLRLFNPMGRDSGAEVQLM